MSAAGAAAVGGASLLGTLPASAAGLALRPAPATPYAVGVRQYTWWRGSRRLTTYVYYPAATGTPGGAPVTNAPVASGVFPIYNFTHGLGASPQGSLFFIRPLAAAGFIVPAPHFQHDFGALRNGDTSRDVSQILTETLALNSSAPFAGRIDTSVGVGVSGHSMGGMTTHGLLSAWPDSRITSAMPQSCQDMGNPSSSVKAKVMFVHGDRDGTTGIASARQAYAELPPAKAFLTFLGGSHTSFWSDSKFPNTSVEWARWTMYGDTAARDRLARAAAGSNTRWEFVPGSDDPTDPVTDVFNLVAQHSGKYADISGMSTAAGARLVQYASTGRTNQQFEFTSTGDGHFKIKARHSGLVLQAASNADGADITQQPDTNATSQQWRLTDHGSGVVSLINRASGKAMDVWGRSTADSARISQYTYSGSPNQRFMRRPV